MQVPGLGSFGSFLFLKLVSGVGLIGLSHPYLGLVGPGLAFLGRMLLWALIWAQFGLLVGPEMVSCGPRFRPCLDIGPL